MSRITLLYRKYFQSENRHTEVSGLSVLRSMSSTGPGFSFHFKSQGYSLRQMGDEQNYKLQPMGIQFYADSVR